MQLKRLFMGFALGISASLLASTSFAQSFPCTQSMIVGKWIFAKNFLVVGGSGDFLGIACPIAIALDGKTSSGTCTVLGVTLLTSPSGQLSINSSCKVTGSISWTACALGACSMTNTAITAAVQLWRSFDGSRLSGFASIHETSGGIVIEEVDPFEIIYKPQ
jgi:hypothetical protein